MIRFLSKLLRTDFVSNDDAELLVYRRLDIMFASGSPSLSQISANDALMLLNLKIHVDILPVKTGQCAWTYMYIVN